jgi:ribosomal protein S5
MAIGGNSHVGLGIKCSKEVATTIRSAIILAICISEWSTKNAVK